MKYPAHPAEILQDILLEGYGLTVEEAAKMLGVAPKTLCNFFEKKTKISHSLAQRLGIAGISTTRFWLAAQAGYDYAQFVNAQKKAPSVDVRAFEKARQEMQARFEADEELKEIDALIQKKLEKRLLEEHADDDLEESDFAESPAENIPRVRNIRKSSNAAAPARV